MRLTAAAIGELAAELIAGVLFLGLYAAVWRVLGAEPADREVWRRLTESGASLWAGKQIAI